MKNKLFVVIFVLFLVSLLSLSFFVGRKENALLSENPDVIMANAEKESAAVKEEEQKDFINITVNQYLEFYRGDEMKLILLGRPSCEYSVIAFPILKNFMYEYGFDIYYLNSDEFSGEDLVNFVNSDEIWEGIGTPRLFLVKNNSIIKMVDGLTDRAHYIEFFKSNGLISKE